MGKIYYIDSKNGKSENDGLTEQSPLNNYLNLTVEPGDTVLFKRGSLFRSSILSPSGKEGAVITWSAYGEGENPKFYGSINLHDASMWKEGQPNVWQYLGTFPSEVCNLIYSGDKECGVLSWTYEGLDEQGKWYYTHMGYRERKCPPELVDAPKILYIYSKGNPAVVYSDIECAVFGTRNMITAREYVTFENLTLKYSGVHGYAAANTNHITIRNCDFLFIGGCVWDRAQQIRFGNAVELWRYGQDFLLEHSYFDNVYDSCVTHQGGTDVEPVQRVSFVNNVFKNYGMGAYEVRDRVGIDTHFDNNICIGAGLGFSLQGETPPRKSEIWPQPMGHHLFIWRINNATEGAKITIKGNVFYQAPYGACTYSTIAPEAEAQFEFDNNTYYKDEADYLIRWDGANYGKNEFAKYQRETGQDKNSVVKNVTFVDENSKDCCVK